MKIKSFLSLIVVSTFLFACLSQASEYKVVFFDVGQGHCTLVHSSKSSPLLVDCGSSQTKHKGRQFKKDTIKKISTKIVDAITIEETNNNLHLIVTHADKDHCNWIKDVVKYISKNSIKLGSVTLGGKASHYSDKFIKFLKENIKEEFIFYPSAQEEEKFSKELLSSKGRLNYQLLAALEDGDKNTGSLVIKISGYDKSCILAGDATKKTTDHIIEKFKEKEAQLKTNTLLASHHGAQAEGCNAKVWLEATSPGYVVFSSGMRTDYYHPCSEIIKRCEAIESIRDFKDNKSHTIFFASPKTKELNGRNVNKYGFKITQKALFCTLSQGDISFTIKKNEGEVSTLTYSTEYNKTFPSSKETLFKLSEASLCGDYQILQKLRFLDLSNLSLNDDDYDELKKLFDRLPKKIKTIKLTNNHLNSEQYITLFETFIKNNTQLRNLELQGNTIQEIDQNKLKKAWSNRGLRF